MAGRLRGLADEGYILSDEQWAFVYEVEKGCLYELTKADAMEMGLCLRCASYYKGQRCMAYLAKSEWCSWPKDRAKEYLTMCEMKDGRKRGDKNSQA